MDTNGELLEYRGLMKRPELKETWSKAMGKEVGRLAQGLKGRVEGTNTIFFIDKSEIPNDRLRDCTYVRICANYRPEKDDPHRVRMTMGGDRVNCPDDCGTPTADLLTVKLLLNSVVSTPGAKFFTMDIKDFYLNTPLKRFEYARIRLSDLPEDIIEEYKLKEKATEQGFVHVEVRRGMYGLPNAGIIAQQLLEKRLEKHGYKQSKFTPGLWSHEWRPIQFTLVVDDFGVKYIGDEHAEHLIQCVKQHYNLTHDLNKDEQGNLYCGVTMEWDYEKREVHLSIPGYVKRALKRFQHELHKVQNQPYPHVPPNYGAKVQYAKPKDESPPSPRTTKNTSCKSRERSSSTHAQSTQPCSPPSAH